jgi:phytanoyl-CoA hydroxylase
MAWAELGSRGLGTMTPADAQRFTEDGYLVLPNFVPQADCEALRARSMELLEAFVPGPSLSLFSTDEQSRTTDAYFLGSGDKVRFFFEPHCMGKDGTLRAEKHLCINKIGHALHDLDKVFAAFSRQPALASAAAMLGLQNPLLLQSMYIFKAPGSGGEVASHQDATFLYTEPLTTLGLWFALEDATRENGCLWALPGGHRGSLRRRFVRTADGGTTMRILAEAPYREEAMVPLEVPQGTLVALHGLLPHRSGPNLSSRSRHAYSLHLIDAQAHYPPDNWLQRPSTFPPRGFV